MHENKFISFSYSSQGQKNFSLPFRRHREDSGYDLFLPKDLSLAPGTTRVSLGIAISIPKGTFAQIIVRSSISARGLIVASSPIDSGYGGELFMVMHNISAETIAFKKNDRISQIVVQRYLANGTKNTTKAIRDKRGFGSSGL